MLEKDVIQYRGFHNIVENGKVTGFQICVRSTYYRGVWLSQIRPGKIEVDGERFSKEDITWTIGGKDYTAAEMAEDSEDFWPNTEAATLTVKKEGGLSQGFHDVLVSFGTSKSYLPPSWDFFDEDAPIDGFRSGTFEKKHMIIV